MRTKIAAGNWKMNLNRNESIKLVEALSDALGDYDIQKNRIILGVPAINLLSVYDANTDKRLEFSAQNIHYKDAGAFTGETSPTMLKDAGISITILGHSERRHYFKEDDEFLRHKVDAALNHHLEVIFCIGETLTERSSGNHFSVVENQIKNALFHLGASPWSHIILAYEPVWAIGTGETATPEQAQEMHRFIRSLIKDQYTNEVADQLSILYGGSVKPSNAREIFSQPDVDGGLVGGASLSASDFSAIVKAL